MPAEEVHRTVLDVASHDVSEVLRFGKEFLDGLYRGVVEPDKVLDEVEVCRGKDEKRRCSKRPAKHHGDNDEVVNKLIEYYYLLSLYYYKRNDPYLSGISLGRTLHYIHDSSFVYTGVAEHNVQEERMRKIVTGNTNIKDLCKNVDVESKTTSSDVIESLCIMYRRSVDTLKRFINDISKTPTREEIEEIEKEKRRVALDAIALTFLGLADIALLVLLPFFFGPIIFLAFILSVILTFIDLLIYSRESQSLKRELAKLGMAKPSLPAIVKLMEGEEIKIIPAY
jgi:hypothetical protein